MAFAQSDGVARLILNYGRYGNIDPNRAPTNRPLSQGNPAEIAPARTSDTELQVLRAGNLSRSGSNVVLDGGAEILYRGYRCFADRIVGDLDTEVFNLTGNVRVIGADAIVYGERVQFDFKNESYISESGKGILKPIWVGGQIKDNLYVNSAKATGTERENQFIDSGFTTCDLEDAEHFEIESAETVVRTGKRIIFRKARIKFFGKTILTIPFLSIPIEDQRSKYTPDVGQSQDEGYYVKNRLGLSASDRAALDARLDYMSRLGAGIGGDYAYANSKMNGLSQVYTILGSVGTLNVRNQHTQQIGSTQLSVTNDFQRNNYLAAPGTTLINSNFLYSIPSRVGNTNLGYQRYSSTFGKSKSESETYTVNDDRQFGKLGTSTSLAYQVNRNEFGGAGGFESKQLDLRIRMQQDFNAAQGVLEYQRLIPVGDSAGSFGNADRTPVLTLTSDANRLLGRKAGSAVPFRTSLSIGEFGAIGGGRLTRSIFDWSLNKAIRSNSRLTLNYNGVFKQSLYSDDTAQYVVGSGFDASYRLGVDTSANLRYSYLRPEGYTPLIQDRTGRTHVSTLDVTTRPIRSVLIGAQTGFDFNRARNNDIGWQQFNLRAEYKPRAWLNLRTMTTYDTFLQSWSSVRLDLTYQPGQTFMTLGARYDGIQKRWSNANLYLANLKWGRTRLGSVLSYNGFTKVIDAAQYNAVYDLHCFELVLNVSEYRTGFRPGREVQFFLRLKAFPTDSLFGIGRRGQGLGSNIGYGN
jgi:LPS-assembly protein